MNWLIDWSDMKNQTCYAADVFVHHAEFPDRDSLEYNMWAAREQPIVTFSVLY